VSSAVVRPRPALVLALACVLAAFAGAWRAQAAARAGAPLASRTLDRWGIADERAFYAPLTGWRARRHDVPWPDPATAAMAADLRRDWLADPFLDVLFDTQILAAGDSLPAGIEERVRAGAATPVVVRAAVGVLGFDLGPRFHVLDLYALGDPLRARLAALRHDPLVPRFLPSLAPLAWRAGHFVRRIPPGYVATLVTGTNRIEDPDLASYWNDVAFASRAPVWSAARCGAILRLSRGRHDPRLQRYEARQGAPP
jgi:hypothetical protein